MRFHHRQLNDEQFGWTSYGRSRHDCETMRHFAETLVEPVEMGLFGPVEPGVTRPRPARAGR